MKKKLPPINESCEHLKVLMQREKQTDGKQRLNALYLLQTGQAKTRKEVAPLLGVNRDTVGRWLTAYQQGGLKALLERKTAPGKTPLLTPEMQQDLKQRLQSEVGFPSYKAIAEFVRSEYQVDIGYDAVYKLVRYNFKAKLKVARKHHKKKRSTVPTIR